jgi:hypothetical protein
MIRLKQCSKNPSHWYSAHSPDCPWCWMSQANYPDPFSLPFKDQPPQKPVGNEEKISSIEPLQDQKKPPAQPYPPGKTSTGLWIAIAGVCVVAAVILFFIFSPLSAGPASPQGDADGTTDKTTPGTTPNQETVKAGRNGEVTITADGDQSYYLGEKITFSGTNTATGTTYIFITGPDLPANGAQIENPDPRNAGISDGDGTTFGVAKVNGDSTWLWNWNSASVTLDDGTYTVYAVSYPKDQDHLTGTQYGTVSIVIKKPFVSAMIQDSVIQQGDTVKIMGSALGIPSKGVQIWILGSDYVDLTTVPVGPDGSFLDTISGETTANLKSGMYYIIVQHPMQNAQFDIVRNATNPHLVVNLQTGASTDIFSPDGLTAAEEVAVAINDPSVDDTYTKLQFLVE